MQLNLADLGPTEYPAKVMKILVAEDSSSVRNLLSKYLTAWGYEVVEVENGDDALSHLQAADGPRLAILDWMMPGVDGLEICRRLREQSSEPYIMRPYTYAILLSAKASSQEMLQGMEAGADDYLVKPFNSDELRLRVRAGRRIISMQEQLVAAHEHLRQEANLDPLTRILNRRAIMSILGRDLARSTREGSALAVLMIDLDHFKLINDNHGHAGGDAVLCATSRRMGEALRAYDALARLGGEEFLAVVPGCDAKGAMSVAERIRRSVANDPVLMPSGNSVHASCSVGAAVFNPSIHQTPEALLMAADAALYQAKNAGRNRVVLHVDPSQPEAIAAGPALV